MRSIITLVALAIAATQATAEIRSITAGIGNGCLVINDSSGTGYAHVNFNDALPTSQTSTSVRFDLTSAAGAVASFDGFVNVDECGVTIDDGAGTITFGSDNEGRSTIFIQFQAPNGNTIDVTAFANPAVFAPGAVPETLDPNDWDLTIHGESVTCDAENTTACEGGRVLSICAPTPVTGACCLNGACIRATPDNCASAGGAYQGDNSSCRSANCETCEIELTGDVPPLIDVGDLLAFLAQYFPASEGAPCP